MAAGDSCFCTYVRYGDDEEWRCRYCGQPEPVIQKGGIK